MWHSITKLFAIPVTVLVISDGFLCYIKYSLLREHTLDGSGWAPTRKLKVGLSQYLTYRFSQA